MTEQAPPGPNRRLTASEEAIARCVARGLNYKRIGAVIGRSARTVEFHVNAIADAIPQQDEDECELTPYQRVLVWAFWTYRLKRAA